MSDNPRRDRLAELTKNKSRTAIEETERAALAAEFPDFKAEEDTKASDEEGKAFGKGK